MKRFLLLAVLITSKLYAPLPFDICSSVAPQSSSTTEEATDALKEMTINDEAQPSTSQSQEKKLEWQELIGSIEDLNQLLKASADDGKWQVANHYIELGADPTIVKIDCSKNDLLHAAILSCNEHSSRFLLNNTKMSPNAKDKDGDSPLHTAAKVNAIDADDWQNEEVPYKNRKQCIEKIALLLLEHGAKPEEKNQHGFTAAVLTIISGLYTAKELKAKYDLYQKDKAQCTIL